MTYFFDFFFRLTIISEKNDIFEIRTKKTTLHKCLI